MAISNIIWCKTDDKMKTQYRIAEYKDHFKVEEWNEKLRNWEEVFVNCRFVNEMNCTMAPIVFNTFEEAKSYVNKLKEKEYPIYHSV